MLFHIFKSQTERREYNGSDFVEIQFCKLPAESKIEQIVSVDAINHWQNDSLYIDNENLFYNEYSSIFDCGVYNNLKSGTIDLCGINYYCSTLIDTFIKKLLQTKPLDYEVLVDWLKKAKAYNGFYILGL